jgi:glycosyltransferase involved in cell wall biosynthesis
VKLTIGVPVYNERERVELALKELLDTAFPVDVEIIVVDDGSTDGSWERLASLSLPDHVRMLRHRSNGGKGMALRTALRAARGDVFVPFDADLEYSPSDLVRMLQPIVDGKTDVVYGTRAFGSHTAFNFWYVMGNKVLNLWTNLVFNCYLSDLASCLKMVRSDVLRSLGLNGTGFEIDAEITAKLLRAGYRPYEVPIEYEARSRAQGKKVGWRDGARAALMITKIRFGLDRVLDRLRP